MSDRGDRCGLYFCPKCGMVQRHSELTQAEIEVLRGYAEGLTTKELAEIRFTSDKTIESHRNKIILKLGVPNLVAAVVKGIRDRLIIVEEI